MNKIMEQNKLPIIETKDYLLLINEEAEIKKGNYILEKELIINIFPDYLTNLDECSKIIAYYPLIKEAKELDLPLLPEPFEDHNYKHPLYGLLSAIDILKNDGFDERCDILSHLRETEKFVREIKQSKQYSLEDMIAFGKKCFYKGFDKSENDDANCFTAWREESNKLGQSLSTKQLPKYFVPEYETKVINHIPYPKELEVKGQGYEKGYPVTGNVLKTITDSEGKEQICGTYLNN